MFLNGHDDEVADMLRNDYRRKLAARFTGDRESGRSADECTDAGSDDGHRRGDGLEVGGAVGVDEGDVLLGGRCRLADWGGKDGVAARRGRTTGVGDHGSGGDVDDGQAARGRPHVLIGGCGESDGLTAGRRADARRDGGGESVGCEGSGELVGGHGGTCAVGSGDGAVDGAAAVMELPAVLTTIAVAGMAPKRTRVAPESPPPVRATDVPPVEGHDDVLTAVTTGGGPEAAAAVESPTADTVVTNDKVTARSNRLNRMRSIPSGSPSLLNPR